MLLRTLAAIAVALGLMAANANAAEMPNQKGAATLGTGFTHGLPLALREETKSVQLAQRGPRRRGRRGRRIGKGVAIGIGILGIAAAIAAAERAKARENNRCRRWADDCDDGYLRACRRYDRNCR